MTQITCFMIEPAGRAALSLRRYSSGTPCTAGKGYHDASVPLFDVAQRVEREGSDRPVFRNDGPSRPEEVPAEHSSRWPIACACGYVFTDADARQVFNETIYRRCDNGEMVTLRNAPPGAMWWLTWMEGFFHPQLGASPLCVMTPGGEWVVDQQASNCTMKDDFNQERHHCWVAHGTPPLVTVDKAGTTCAAGAGSIQAGNYHGFLRNGFLVD